MSEPTREELLTEIERLKQRFQDAMVIVDYWKRQAGRK